MWFAILITVIAATGNNIGKALQKEAVHSLPRFSLQPAVFRCNFLTIPLIISIVRNASIVSGLQSLAAWHRLPPMRSKIVSTARSHGKQLEGQ